MSLLRSLAEHFKDLGNGVAEPKSRHHGICNEFEVFLDEHFKDSDCNEFKASDSNERVLAVRTLRTAFKSWPEYSGNPDYPVPHPCQAPDDGYQHSCDMWDITDYSDDEGEYLAYGNARRRLCLWLARAFLTNAEVRYA